MEIYNAIGLQEQEGLIREVEILINVHRNQEAKNCRYFWPSLGGRKEKQARMRLAYAHHNSPQGPLDWNHWSRGPALHSAVEIMTVPSDVEYTAQLDMAATAALDNATGGVYIGEVRSDGRFLPLNYPMRVGRKVADMEGPIFVPEPSAAQVALASGRSDVIGVVGVHEFIHRLGSTEGVNCSQVSRADENIYDPADDLRHLVGQSEARKALEMAMAGGHHLLLVGPPGEGKSELAKRAYTVCPPLTMEEAVEVSAMWETPGTEDEIKWVRPFVKATPQTTPTGLHGGGSSITGPKPGLVSKAHRGLLMADEMFLWTRKRLDSLRMPLEDGEVTISRRDWTVTFPADFQLIATANPCPCGYWSPAEYDDGRECRCTDRQKQSYVNKISGPILDRIDLQAWVPRLGEQVLNGEEGETSAEVRQRVTRALEMQRERYARVPIAYNSEVGPAYYHLCNEEPNAMKMLESLGEQKNMSTRRIFRIRRVARTVADLAGRDTVNADDIERATEYMSVPLPEWS